LVRDSAPLTLAVDQESEQRPTDADGDGHRNGPVRRIAVRDEAEANGVELLIRPDPETDEERRQKHKARERLPCCASRCEAVYVHVHEGYDARTSGVTSLVWASVPE
jgi:hypothetical protein